LATDDFSGDDKLVELEGILVTASNVTAKQKQLYRIMVVVVALLIFVKVKSFKFVQLALTGYSSKNLEKKSLVPLVAIIL